MLGPSHCCSYEVSSAWPVVGERAGDTACCACVFAPRQLAHTDAALSLKGSWWGEAWWCWRPCVKPPGQEEDATLQA